MITSKNQAGYLIVYTLILVFGLMSVGLVALSVVGATYKFTKDDAYRKNASYMARACVSVVANELTEDPAFSGFSPASQVLYDRTGVNGGIASCIVDSITDGDGNARIVQLTSYIHRYSGDPNPIQFQARAVLDAQEGQFGSHMEGGILVGNGGMYSDRTGDITTPQMNLLGRLNKSGTGNYNVEDNGVVYVHNIGCGTSLDWPQHCTGQDPILTPGTGNIYGDICAPGQSDTSKLRYLNPSCTLPAMTMPAFDKAGFVSGLGGPIISPSTILGNGGCYTVSGSRNNGTTYTVPAGATIAGTLDLRTLPELYAAGTCRISFQGNAYIEGGDHRERCRSKSQLYR